jgi:hypothetical protein
VTDSSPLLAAPRERALALTLALTLLVLAGLEGSAASGEWFVRGHDEGLVLTSALRVQHGDLPYREFVPAYGPAESALVAVCSWGDGPQLLALRALRGGGVVLLALAAAACVWLTGGRASAALPVLAVLAGASVLTLPSLGLLASSVCALELARERARPTPWLLGAGALAGLAGVFRQEVGVLAAGSGVVVLLAFAPPGVDLRQRARTAGLFVAGGLPFLAVYGVLFALGGWEPFAQHVAASQAAMPYRTLAYPFVPSGPPAVWLLTLCRATLPVLVVVGAPLWVGRAWWAHWRAGAPQPSALPAHLALLLIGFLPYAWWRPDGPHLLPTFVWASALVGQALAGPEARLSPAARLRLRWAALGLLALVLALRASQALAVRGDPDLVRSSLRGLSGVLIDRRAEDELAAAVAAVDSWASPDEPLYVGYDDHSRVYANDAFFYVLCGRPVAPRSHDLLPGVITEEAGQRALLEQLEPVRVIVLARGTYREEANQSRTRGSTMLDEELQRRFRLVEELPGYLIAVRRGAGEKIR